MQHSNDGFSLWEGNPAAMDGVDIKAIMEVTRNIFQGARTQPPEQFQDWALEQVKTLIQFDSGKWVTGAANQAQGIVHTIHLHQLNDPGMTEYLKYRHQDRLLAKLILTRGDIQTFSMYEVISREEFIQTGLYTDYCKKHGEEQLISTAVPEPNSNLFSIISFYRNRYEDEFTPQEKEIKTIITPVLTEARSQNLFLNLYQLDRKSGGGAAISDDKGILKETEPGFSDLILKEWPCWQGPVLKFVPEELLDGAQEAQYQGNNIVIDLSIQHDLVLLQARPKGIIDSLTPAEKLIAQQLMKGLMNKEIANQLNISPKTVSNHLHNIFTKLNVSNRQRAIALLKETS